MTPPPAPDRTTLPLLRTAALVGLALSAWPAFGAGGPRWSWLVALAAGLLYGLLYRHPYRALGLVPVGLTLGAVASIVARIWGWGDVTAGVAGAGSGLAVGAFLDTRAAGRMADVSGWLIGLLCWGAAALGVLPMLAVRFGSADADRVRDSFTLGAGLALGVAAGFAWVRLFRPAFELGLAVVSWPVYRIRTVGPGLADFPRGGPCLVVANHACWFDPLFLGKGIPRPITPMMTSVFYDLPVIRWLMVNVFHTIRVEEKALRQGVPPELGEAVAALDRGECVVLFPEGYLRRSDDRPLKRFGRGVWHILQQRPDTPVYACWIEGAWGSFTSYRGGPPTKGKKPDFWRRIDVAVPEPITVSAEELAHHLKTRLALMNHVVTARALLGLPEVPAYLLPTKDEGDEAGEKA